MIIRPARNVRGELKVPGDKSISHRSIMFGSIAKGRTEITGFLESADCLSTISCFRKMGVEITRGSDGTVTVYGRGLRGLKAPSEVLDCGNSGTTTRLISGILAAQDFETTLTGDESIRKRPMRRIIEPLSLMGADITSVLGNDCSPLRICGRPLHGIEYTTKVASAQVKSAILLAGLYADGPTSVTEPDLSRNHTELMGRYFGADITSSGTTATVRPAAELYGRKVEVAGDISSAIYFITAALLLPGSEVLIRGVGVNPTRFGSVKVLREMGADITLLNESGEGDPQADLLVRSSGLKGVTIGGSVIPAMIDELPTVALAACFAEGTTVIKDAAELRVKESDRIALMVKNLRAMGADVEETTDGMIVHGGKPLHGARIDTQKDHRIAMTFAVAALLAEGETELADGDCVNISYPEFYQDLDRLTIR